MSKSLQQHWDEQLPIFSKISSMGFPGYLASLSEEEIKSSKISGEKTLSCMDEGIRDKDGVRSAGSCILQDLEHATRKLDGKVDVVYSHEDCSEARLFCRQNAIPETEADTESQKWAKELAASIGAKYGGQISLSDIQRPASTHISRCLYYIASGSFNPNKITGLPQGFVVSRGVIGKDNAIEELILAYGTASGKLGFGQLITESQPFHVFIVTNGFSEETSLETIENEIKEYIDGKGMHILIDGATI